MIRIANLIGIGILLLPLHVFGDEIGVTSSKILIGQSTDSQARPKGLSDGAEVYFERLNAKGGVNGRKIELVTMDDNYDPQKAAENTAKFINELKVFALFQPYGAATIRATMPLIEKANIPLVAPGAGSEFLRNPVNKNVFNVRLSYFGETAGLVSFLHKTKGIKDICLLVQDDAFGNDGRNSAVKALSEQGLEPKAVAKYQRLTSQVSSAVDELKKAGCKGVLAWAQTTAALEFLRESKAASFDPVFAGAVVLSNAEFFSQAGKYSDHVFISMAVPRIDDKSIPLAVQFNKDMSAAGKGADPSSFEGYLNAAIFTESVRLAGKDLTREGLRNSFNTKMKNFSVGGIKVSYSATDHQGLETVHMVRVKADGSLETVK
jgi:branched-chain amino acid transport system substrate-binding protein